MIEDRPIAENPVTNIETEDKFNRAIAKSTLLFENVERTSQNIQAALLYNGSGTNKRDFSVIYISNRDKDAHITKLNYDYVEYAGLSFMHEKGVLLATNRANKLRGVLAHNGLEIVPVRYTYIRTIGTDLLLGDTGNEIDVYDYTGRFRMKSTAQIKLPWKATTIGEKPAAPFYLDLFKDSSHARKIVIFIAYNNKIYYLACLGVPTTAIVEVKIEEGKNRGIRVKANGVSWFSSHERLLKMMTPIESGLCVDYNTYDFTRREG